MRVFEAAGLRDLDVRYSHSGRLPLSGWHYPRALAAVAPRRLSDNLMIIGRRA